MRAVMGAGTVNHKIPHGEMNADDCGNITGTNNNKLILVRHSGNEGLKLPPPRATIKVFFAALGRFVQYYDFYFNVFKWPSKNLV